MPKSSVAICARPRLPGHDHTAPGNPGVCFLSLKAGPVVSLVHAIMARHHDLIGSQIPTSFNRLPGYKMNKNLISLPVLALLLLSHINTSHADGNHMDTPATQAAAMLKFRAVPDNHCQQRDHHGQLALLVNADPVQAIQYRLTRYFGDKRQPGIARGDIAPGEEVKLGCTRIDGREQVWKITRVSFLPAAAGKD